MVDRERPPFKNGFPTVARSRSRTEHTGTFMRLQVEFMMMHEIVFATPRAELARPRPAIR